MLNKEANKSLSMKRIEEMINKPIIKNNDGIELAVPTEWMNAKFYADIGIDDLSHYYKCALSRAAQYKNKDLRAQYKELSAIIKKQIENRSKIKDDEMETNEAKLRFDGMRNILKIKLDTLLENIKTDEIWDDYFKNIHVFNEEIFDNGNRIKSL